MMGEWLNGFAFHADLPWWAFVVAGGLAIGIAFLTVSLQSIKSAMANPVHALKNE